MDKSNGAYLGTEIGNKWWKRYAQDEFFSRGNGQYWLDDKAFSFNKAFTSKDIIIPFDSILGVGVGYWHSGRWALGNKILKITWAKDSLTLSSGFIVLGKTEKFNEFKALLEAKLKSKNQNR